MKLNLSLLRPGLPPTEGRKPKAVSWRALSIILATLMILVGSVSVALVTFARGTMRLDVSINTAVLTQKNDLNRTGWNPNETILNTSNVNATQFGKRVSYPVDGVVYAQPLYVPNLTINGVQHNVVFVATEHDSVYAFDADVQTTTPPAPLWHTSYLINGAKTVSTSDVTCSDIKPEYGITSTPVIDLATNTMYLTTVTNESSHVIGRFHALDITTGKDKVAPTFIQASVSGTGAGSSGGKISFSSRREGQRAGLLLLNGVVYAAFGSHCDNDPYHGWILGYDATTLQQAVVYNNTASGTRGGIWEGGTGLSADDSGHIYYASGNGTFNLNSGGNNAGDSVVKLSRSGSSLKVNDYFTPFNQSCLESLDLDLSAGVLLIPTDNQIVTSGKEGRIFNIDRNNMGHYHTVSNPCSTTNLNRSNIDQISQELPKDAANGGIWGSPSYWNGPGGQFIYTVGVKDHLKAWHWSNDRISTTFSSESPESYTYPGGNPAVSSNGSVPGTGIVWVLDRTNGSMMHAYDAMDVSHELYTSNQNASRDALGVYTKFSVPTVANGEVFVGTQSTLVIYGLLGAVTPPSNGFNNAGIADDAHPSGANFDSHGNSYSSQALQQAGASQGQPFTFNGVTFTWPNAAPGALDNYVTGGQTLDVNPVDGATTLAFLGSSNNGPSSGTVTVTFTDGTTQTFSLGFSDWTLNGGKSQPLAGNQKALTLPYRDTATGKETKTTYVFYAETTIPSGKVVKNVTLPTVVSQGALHVFALGVKA